MRLRGRINKKRKEKKGQEKKKKKNGEVAGGERTSLAGAAGATGKPRGDATL